MKPVLITAATKWEAQPLAHGLKLSPTGNTRWEGRIGERTFSVART